MVTASKGKAASGTCFLYSADLFLLKFAQLVKVYASPHEGERCYNPTEVLDAVPSIVSENPVREQICTSHVE